MKNSNITLLFFGLFLSVFITNAQTVTLVGQTNPSCSGACIGSVSFSLSGATAPYTVIVSNTFCAVSNTISFASNTVTINNLCKCDSNYQFTFYEASLTQISTQSVLVVPLPLPVFATNSALSCAGACDATATVNVFGGVAPPLSYTWMPIGVNSVVATNLCAGMYTVIVRDANGCEGNSILLIINYGPCAGIQEFEINEQIDIFPNPAINFISLSDNSKTTKSWDVIIRNITGQTVLIEKDIKEIDVSNLSPGLYYLKIATDSNKSYYSKFVKQ